MFLTLIKENVTYEIKFKTKTPKTKINRLIRELNDLCASIYKVSNNKVDDWILVSYLTNNDIKSTYIVDYTSFYYFIRGFRTGAIKNSEIINNIKFSLQSTITSLKIIKTASEQGFIDNYRTIKRKYTARKQSQEKKIIYNTLKYNFVCTVRYFYYSILSTLEKWSIGPMQNEICHKVDTSNILSESEASLMEECINHSISTYELNDNLGQPLFK